MNPYPISDDHGVIGYGCGRCRAPDFASFQSYWDALHKEENYKNDPPEEFSAELWAAKCCLCWRCGEPTERAKAQYCDLCYWRIDFGHAWWNIGAAIRLGVNCEAEWGRVADQLDYGPMMGELLERIRSFDTVSSASRPVAQQVEPRGGIPGDAGSSPAGSGRGGLS